MASTTASDIGTIYKVVHPNESLNPDDPRYVDLFPARGNENLVNLIARRISYAEPPHWHCHLITGHRGSGKSTELRHLQKVLEDDKFLVVYLDVEQALDLYDVEYLDILLAVAYQLEITGREEKLNLDKDLVEDVGKWFADAVVTEAHAEEVEMSYGGEVEIGIELPLLAKMLAYLKTQIRSGASTRFEIRRALERRLPDFIERLQRLVRHFTQQAQKAGYKGIVLIVDSLERMPLKMLNEFHSNHSIIFLDHAEQLKCMPCHLVYTVPVSLINDRHLGISYSNIDLISMVKIATVDKELWEPGRKLLYTIVTKRVNVGAVFVNPNLVYKLIDASGGVIRDLMRLLLFAADFSEKQIDQDAVDKAIRKFWREYDDLIHEEDLSLLAEVAINPYRAGSERLSRLMFNRLVLPYVNDKRWLDIHPAVRESPKFRSYISGSV